MCVCVCEREKREWMMSVSGACETVCLPVFACVCLCVQSNLPMLEAAVLSGTGMPVDVLLTAMLYLIGVTDNDETEIFKLCLDYWALFSHQLYASDRTYIASNPAVSALTRVFVCVRERVRAGVEPSL